MQRAPDAKKKTHVCGNPLRTRSVQVRHASGRVHVALEQCARTCEFRKWAECACVPPVLPDASRTSTNVQKVDHGIFFDMTAANLSSGSPVMELSQWPCSVGDGWRDLCGILKVVGVVMVTQPRSGAVSQV
jgi:hypothetical protein